MRPRHCQPAAAQPLSLSHHTTQLTHVRAADAKLVSASSDLTIMVAHSIRDAQDFKNPRVMAARRELVRLINLAHILVCISGDGANHVFAQRPITKCVRSSVSTHVPHTAIHRPHTHAKHACRAHHLRP